MADWTMPFPSASAGQEWWFHQAGSFFSISCPYFQLILDRDTFTSYFSCQHYFTFFARFVYSAVLYFALVAKANFFNLYFNVRRIWNFPFGRLLELSCQRGNRRRPLRLEGPVRPADLKHEGAGKDFIMESWLSLSARVGRLGGEENLAGWERANKNKYGGWKKLGLRAWADLYKMIRLKTRVNIMIYPL